MKSNVDYMASRILVAREIADSVQEEDGSGEEKYMEENDELTCYS
jgi:hypothetical protein